MNIKKRCRFMLALMVLPVCAWAQSGFTGLGVHATFIREAEAFPGDPPDIQELEIIKVDVGSPAARAGIRVGDRIVSIENCVIPGCSAARARRLLLLKPGDELKLLMQRDDLQYAAQIVATAPPTGDTAGQSTESSR